MVQCHFRRRGSPVPNSNTDTKRLKHSHTDANSFTVADIPGTSASSATTAGNDPAECLANPNSDTNPDGLGECDAYPHSDPDPDTIGEANDCG